MHTRPSCSSWPCKCPRRSARVLRSCERKKIFNVWSERCYFVLPAVPEGGIKYVYKKQYERQAHTSRCQSCLSWWPEVRWVRKVRAVINVLPLNARVRSVFPRPGIKEKQAWILASKVWFCLRDRTWIRTTRRWIRRCQESGGLVVCVCVGVSVCDLVWLSVI